MQCSIGSHFVFPARMMLIFVQGNVCEQFAPRCELQKNPCTWFVVSIWLGDECRPLRTLLILLRLDLFSWTIKTIYAEYCRTYSLNTVVFKVKHCSSCSLIKMNYFVICALGWPDGVLQTPRLETKATLVWQDIYNFVCVGNGLTFGNGWSDKTVHKETLFW